MKFKIFKKEKILILIKNAASVLRLFVWAVQGL